MRRDQRDAAAEVIIGVITWQGARADGRREDAGDAGDAEVIRFAPYLLARRGRAVSPPARRV